jgi:hypothetical protein
MSIRLWAQKRPVSLRRVIGTFLALALATGVATVPEAWTATYYVSTSGSNANTPAQAQSPATPWKTLTFVLAQTLAPGDVVQAQPGTYDTPGNGETFPLALVNGVTLQGNPANPSSTKVSAPAGNVVFQNSNSLSSQTTLTGLTITHDAAGGGAAVSLDVSSTVAMAPQITHNAFVGFTADTAIAIDDQGGGTTRSFTGLIDHNTFSQFLGGIHVQADGSGTGGTFSPTISNNTFTSQGIDGIGIVVQSSFGGTVAPTIQGNTMTGVGLFGIEGNVASLTSSGATFQPVVQQNQVGTAAAADVGVLFALHSFNVGKSAVVFSPTISGNTVTGPGGIVVVVGTTSSSAGTAGTFTSNATISGNTLSGQTKNPAIVAAFQPLGTPAIGTFNANWTIDNNTVTGPGSDGILVQTTTQSGHNLGTAGGSLKINVTNNVVTNAGAGGVVADLPGVNAPNLSRAVHIQGNTVSGSQASGISVGYVPVAANVLAEDTQVRDNYLHGNTQAGLEVSSGFDVTRTAGGVPLVRCNTITGNMGDGIRHDSSASFAVDYGTASSPGNNTLSGNTTSGQFDFDNLVSTSQTAQNNWWGSAGGPNPATQIHGNVKYMPFLTMPPSVAMIPLTVTVVNDVPPPGPSVGDTLRYTATITMSNTCGCSQAVFTSAIPANVSEVAGSASASQGTVVSENPIQVNLGSLLASSPPITVQWNVVVNSGTSVSAQGFLSCNGASLPSNDPSNPTPGSPTVTTLVAPAIASVPTLGETGVAALIGGLLFAGLAVLRRRRLGDAAASDLHPPAP